MRLAFYSPLNPVSTGISDYSEELLSPLAREFDITLVVDGYKPSNPALAAFPVLNAPELVSRSSSFDLILYHMGNSPAHDQIYRILLDIPGVVVMHDVVLHHLRAWQTIDRRDVAGYKRAMREDYGDAGAELAELEATWLAGLDRFDFPLSGTVARAARALVVHSEYAARHLEALAPQTPIGIIPMGVPLPPLLSPAEARAALGLPARDFVIAAFGEIHPNKRVTVALEAFARFHAQHPGSLFVLVGRESPNYEVDGLIRRLGIADAVRQVGFAPRGDYERYIAAADLCLNLRYPTAGETSASLLRLFAAGKAVVVTRTGAYAELPAGTCASIDADEYEEDLLAAHFELFAARPDLVAALGANARAFVEKCHTLELSAASYADWLRAVAAGAAATRSYLVPWRPEPAAAASAAAEIYLAPQEKAESASSSPVEEPGTGSDTRIATARAWAELGLDADDPALAAVARALADVDPPNSSNG